ncbi:muscarinic acetylcholine receptor M3-like isoform X2 [Asterias rubens]|uniref:muscarinic acetylcholine receptor M3-like isoform X2 n=1 Tax=Asterias rubens TaxID=7604 RepID=UPI001455D5AC|nr:muscarinic acetylcholine receptor M3-like isoform X2 [Asterias rubens]
MDNYSATGDPFTSSIIENATTNNNDTNLGRFDIEMSKETVIWNILFYSIIGPIALAGNTLSVFVSHRILTYRESIPDMITGTLAAFDLLNIVSVHTPTIISMANKKWTGGTYVCSYQYFMAWSCLKTSFFIILLLTIDRYIALTKPFYYRGKVTIRKMKIAIFALVLFSFGSTSVTIIWFSDEIALLPNWYLCMNSWGTASQYYSYILAFYGLTFILGVVVFNVCNIGIVYSLMRHNKKTQKMRLRVLSEAQDRRERRVAKIIESLSVVFMLFWMPYLVFIVLNQYGVFYNELMEDLSIRVLFTNTILNPAIYGLFNKTYRHGYIYFVRRLLYFALCRLIKKPKDKKILYLRRSYLQHRYARKTRSLSSGLKPPLNNGFDLPHELIQSTDGDLELASNNISDSNLNSTYMDSHDHTGLDNTGFMLDSGVDTDQMASQVFTISERGIGIAKEKQRDCSCTHKYINGKSAIVDSLTSEYQEMNPNDLNFTTESTWL